MTAGRPGRILPGTCLPCRTAGIEKRALPCGVVPANAAIRCLEPNILFMDVRHASAFVYPQRPNYVTQINVTLQPGADREAVRQELRQVLPAPLKVQTISEINESIRDITAGLELGFAIGGAGALVVGLFLVYNALSVSVAERRHDIGILRSVGADARRRSPGCSCARRRSWGWSARCWACRSATAWPAWPWADQPDPQRQRHAAGSATLELDLDDAAAGPGRRHGHDHRGCPGAGPASRHARSRPTWSGACRRSTTLSIG